MALPKVRQTSSRRNRRRAHHALKSIPVSVCPKCKEQALSHTACKNCGTYNKREVMDVIGKLDKKDKKKEKKSPADEKKEEK